MAKRGPKARTAANSGAKSGAGGLWVDVRPPSGLSDGALAEYSRLVGILKAVGTLERTDPRMVELYAINYDLIRRATEQIDCEGLTTETAEGRAIAHPLLSAINTATIRLRGLMNDMGLTPSSSKLTDTIAEAKPSDPWAGILNVTG